MEEWQWSVPPPEGVYHLRNAKDPGGPTHYGLAREEVETLWVGKDKREDWYCSQMVPAEVERTLILQGEVQQAFPGGGRCGLELYFSTDPKPQRLALRDSGRQTSGILAGFLLREALCVRSWEWLNVLLDRYPGHVIEFSTYRRKWGMLPDYNTLFWECRLF